MFFPSTVRDSGGSATVVAAEACEGTWGASPRGCGAALEWTHHPALKPGDRYLCTLILYMCVYYMFYINQIIITNI